MKQVVSYFLDLAKWSGRETAYSFNKIRVHLKHFLENFGNFWNNFCKWLFRFLRGMWTMKMFIIKLLTEALEQNTNFSKLLPEFYLFFKKTCLKDQWLLMKVFSPFIRTSYNLEQIIWNKIKKSSEIWPEQKTLVTHSAYTIILFNGTSTGPSKGVPFSKCLS